MCKSEKEINQCIKYLENLEKLGYVLIAKTVHISYCECCVSTNQNNFYYISNGIDGEKKICDTCLKKFNVIKLKGLRNNKLNKILKRIK